MPTQLAPRPARPDHGPSDDKRTRSHHVSLVILVLAIALIALALLTRDGSKSHVAATKNPTAPGAGASGPGQSGVIASSSADPAADPNAGASSATNDGPVDMAPVPGSASSSPELPLQVSASDTAHLHDLDPVVVHVVPNEGSQVFGFEAFLCKGDESYTHDSDVRPTQSGKCVSKPLSTGSNDYQEVRAAPPYGSVDTTFSVGAGSDSYQTQDGRDVTITCGPGSPCALVLKLQFPNGFGFQVIPLTYE